MIEVMRTILPVIAMLVIGILSRRSGMISREGIGALKDAPAHTPITRPISQKGDETTYIDRGGRK